MQYVDPDDAAEAKYEMDGQILLGRELTVVFAEENRKKPSEMRARERMRWMDLPPYSSPCHDLVILVIFCLKIYMNTIVDGGHPHHAILIRLVVDIHILLHYAMLELTLLALVIILHLQGGDVTQGIQSIENIFHVNSSSGKWKELGLCLF